MHVIHSVSHIPKNVIADRPHLKDSLIFDMLHNLSNEILKNKYFDISEKNFKGGTDRGLEDDVEIKIKAFVMTSDELKEAHDILRSLKKEVSWALLDRIDRLRSLIIP